MCIYTGPVDRYFDYRFGELGWRTLDFEIERLDVDDFQGASVVNYPDLDVPFTRIHEFRHLHPERRYGDKTLIMREYSRFASATTSPITRSAGKTISAATANTKNWPKPKPNVIFAGRLGTYRYLDMHQAIGAALNLYEKKVAPWLTGERLEPDATDSRRMPAAEQSIAGAAKKPDVNELMER